MIIAKARLRHACVMADSRDVLSSACCSNNSSDLADLLSNIVQNNSLNVTEVYSVDEVHVQEQITSKEDEILKFINDTQRAIAVTSSEEVKGKLSQDSTADLFAKRETILQICQRKFPDCPKDKLIRRQTRHGGRTANDKLATDIIALIKYSIILQVKYLLNLTRFLKSLRLRSRHLIQRRRY